MMFRNNIRGYGDVDPKELVANDLNFRVHPSDQNKVVQASLDDLGWFDMVMVSANTSRILNGHLRVSIAIQRGEPTVPVRWVDVTEDEEQAILASYDAIGLAAVTDNNQLKGLLQSIVKPSNALGNFYSKVLATLEKKDQAKKNKPKKVQPPIKIRVGNLEQEVPADVFKAWFKPLKKINKPDELAQLFRERLGF